MDCICIKSFSFEMIIGVLPWERQLKQRVNLSITFWYDTTAAAVSDELDDALDYSALCPNIIAYSQAHPFKLIEAYANQLKEHILETFPKIQRITLEVQKPGAIPDAQYVSITTSGSQGA